MKILFQGNQMKKFDDSVTIVIGTVGYPSFKKCLSYAEELYKMDERIKDLVIIKDEYPTSAWLNKMRVSAKTAWILQVDEDMYLNENSVTELLVLAHKYHKKGTKILNASSLLHDIFLNTKIGSLKLWNREALQHLKFENVQGSDRKIAKDAQKLGYQNVATNLVLGLHDSAPSKDIAFFKYREHIMKVKRFQSEEAARKAVHHIRKISFKHGEIGKYALLGAKEGLKLEENITKNFKENQKEFSRRFK